MNVLLLLLLNHTLRTTDLENGNPELGQGLVPNVLSNSEGEERETEGLKSSSTIWQKIWRENQLI